MRGTKFDFYKANIVNKAKLFVKHPSYIWFYFGRFRKYTSSADFEAFIISYPKSGRTWLQKLLIEAMHLSEGKSSDIADISELHEQCDFPKTLSTHAGSSWEEIVKNETEIQKDDFAQYEHAKIIYLYRDPRDVLVSQYYHIIHRSGYPKFDKDSLILNPNVGLKKIIHFMNKWAKFSTQHQNVLALGYYQLKSETQDYLKQIFDFLEIDMDDSHIDLAIQQSSLSRMQAAEGSKAKNPWSNTDPNKSPNSFHSRKGITGEYKSFFSSDEIASINNIIKDSLDPYYSHYIYS